MFRTVKISPDGDRGCYTHKGAFIPGCWGGVNHGPSGCYCKRVIKTNKTGALLAMKKQMDRLTREVARTQEMTARIEQAFAANRTPAPEAQ